VECAVVSDKLSVGDTSEVEAGVGGGKTLLNSTEEGATWEACLVGQSCIKVLLVSPEPCGDITE